LPGLPTSIRAHYDDNDDGDDDGDDDDDANEDRMVMYG
jgi:hypothetical protein